MEQQLDVLSVGDVVTDAFVKLFDDKAWTYVDEYAVIRVRRRPRQRLVVVPRAPPNVDR